MSTELAQDQTYHSLCGNLEELIRVYRLLLEIVRKEKDLLVQAQVDQLNECNHQKETLLHKIKGLELQRMQLAQEFARQLGLDINEVRLLEIARRCSEEKAERLRGIHAALDVILKRLVELNKENEVFAQSALKSLNGAVDEIKGSLSGSSTYEKKGKKNYGPDKAGNIVSRQA